MEKHEIIIEKAIKINNIITYIAGNNSILRDRSLLESAIGGAFQTMFGQDLYQTDEEKAFALFVGIARNHPFIDGNKRTAALVCDFYLNDCGLELELETKDKFKLLLNIVENNIKDDQGLFLFKEYVKPINSINRKQVTKEIEEDFVLNYNKMKSLLDDGFNSLGVDVLDKYVIDYSRNKGINYIDLLNIVENIERDNKNERSIEKSRDL